MRLLDHICAADDLGVHPLNAVWLNLAIFGLRFNLPLALTRQGGAAI
jgi:hypothetical protein